MHLIKEHLFGLKKQVKQQPHEEQGRVLVHDRLQVRGDILSSLPVKFGSEFFVALILVPVKKTNTFTIGVGSLRITLKSNMTLKPNLETLQRLADQHDNTLSLIGSDGKHMYLHFSSNEMFDRWHLALREALAEMILTESFGRIKDGSLSIRKIEMAIQKGQLLVSDDNLHMQKARRMLEAKLSLKQVLARLTKNPQAVSREEAELFLQSIGGDTMLQKDTQFQLLQSLAPKLYSDLALESLQAPITNNISVFSLNTSASVNESISATLKQFKSSPERPISPLMHIKSPIRNRFHQSLTEVTLHSTGGRKNKLPRQEIKDFCNVLIDDAGAMDHDAWGEVFQSPAATPLPNKQPMHHITSSIKKRDKRRKNRVIKFKFGGSSESSASSANSSAEKKPVTNVVSTAETTEVVVEEQQDDEVWVDVEPTEAEEVLEEKEEEAETVVVQEEEEPLVEVEAISEHIEDTAAVTAAIESVLDVSVAVTDPSSPSSEESDSSSSVESIEPEAEEVQAAEAPESLDAEIAMLLQEAIAPTVFVSDAPSEVAASIATNVENLVASKVVELAPSVWDSQDAVFEQDYKELFGEEHQPVQEVTEACEEESVAQVESSAVESAEEQVVDPIQLTESSASNSSEIVVIDSQELVEETEVLETPVKSAAPGTPLILEVPTADDAVVVELLVASPEAMSEVAEVEVLAPEPTVTVTPFVTPAKSELTLKEFNAFTKSQAALSANTTSTVVPSKRVTPELIIRVRPRGRRVQNKAFKSRNAASVGIVAPSNVPNENTPPPAAGSAVNGPVIVIPQCSPQRSKLSDSFLSGNRSPFREIGNSHNSIVNMLLHGDNDDKSDKFRNLKGFPLLPSNSKAFNSITNSLAKIDTPIRVSDSHTTTSVFTMRPADNNSNAGLYSLESIGTPVVSAQPPSQQQQQHPGVSIKKQSPAEVLLSELTSKFKPNPASSECVSKLKTSNYSEKDFNALLEALMAEPESAPAVTESAQTFSGSTVIMEEKVETAAFESPTSESTSLSVVEEESVVIESPQTVEPTLVSKQTTVPVMKSKTKANREATKNKAILTLNKDFTFTVNDKTTVSSWKKHLLIYGLFLVCLLPLIFLSSHLVQTGGSLQAIQWASPSAAVVPNHGRLNIETVRRDYLEALQHYEEVGGYDAENPLTVSEVELRIIVSSPIKMSRVLQLSKRKIHTILVNALKAMGKGVKKFFQNVVGFVTFKAIEM